MKSKDSGSGKAMIPDPNRALRGCERPLTASWSQGRTERYAYYRCQNRSCKAVNVRREILERLLLTSSASFNPSLDTCACLGKSSFTFGNKNKSRRLCNSTQQCVS